jgi:chromosomal replication initiation ATPase DnaA
LSRQLRLKLQRPSSFRRQDLIVSPANAEAVRAIDSWKTWHGGCLALVGPSGSGKSHLGAVWAEAVHAAVVDVPVGIADLAGLHGRPVLIEHAERQDSEVLFHLINHAGEEGSALLLTSRRPPAAWPAGVPDLRSRLNALQVVELGPPDDEILAGALHKFFRERNIKPAEDLVPYLLKRIERSIPVAREIVRRLDEAGDAQRRPISRALAKDILDSTPELLGLDDRTLAEPDGLGDNGD